MDLGGGCKVERVRYIKMMKSNHSRWTQWNLYPRTKSLVHQSQKPHCHSHLLGWISIHLAIHTHGTKQGFGMRDRQEGWASRRVISATFTLLVPCRFITPFDVTTSVLAGSRGTRQSTLIISKQVAGQRGGWGGDVPCPPESRSKTREYRTHYPAQPPYDLPVSPLFALRGK